MFVLAGFNLNSVSVMYKGSVNYNKIPKIYVKFITTIFYHPQIHVFKC